MLLLICKDEANSRVGDGSGDRKPCEKEVFAGDRVAHEDDEQRKGNGQDLRCNRGRGRRGRHRKCADGWLAPTSSQQDDAGIGKHPDNVAPTGSSDRVRERKVIRDVCRRGKRESQDQHQTKRTEPGRHVGAGAKQEAQGKKRIAKRVEDEDVSKDRVLLGPTGGREEKIEIRSDGYDGDLDEIEDARPVDARGSLVGGREKEQRIGAGQTKKSTSEGHGDCAAFGTKL